MMNVLHIWTADGLRLQGVRYHAVKGEICVLFMHGMSGNFIENYFGNVLGETLQKNGYGFIHTHNRGYNHINDIATNRVGEQNSYETIRIGAVYERLEESVLDIDAWIRESYRLAYKKLVLVGHSLGCNKTIHYIHKNYPAGLIGLILLSPPDMVANGKELGKSRVYERQLSEAIKNVATGESRKLLSDMLWNWYTLSSQTFLDMFVGGCPADNLPIMRNPPSFLELGSIRVPVLSIMGQYDDIVVRSLEEDMNLLQKRATNAPSFTKVFLQGANHTYDNHEEELSVELVRWLENIRTSSI